MFATDIVVVGIVLGPEAAALYAIPAKLFTLAFGLGSVGTSLLYPALAEHEGAGEEDRQRRLLLAGPARRHGRGARSSRCRCS